MAHRTSQPEAPNRPSSEDQQNAIKSPPGKRLTRSGRLGGPQGAAEVPPEMSPVVRSWIEHRVPRNVPVALWSMNLRSFVVPTVLDYGPTTLIQAKDALRFVTKLAAWCLEEGLDLDREIVLDPDTVERFTTSLTTSPTDRASCRSLLRRMGRKLTKRAPWQPPPEVIHLRPLAPPYSSQEVHLLRDAAHAQATPATRRRAIAIIALGLGAGLNGRWTGEIRGRDVLPLGEGLGVRVGPPTERIVPVLAPYEADLHWLASGRDDDLVVGGIRRAPIGERFRPPPGVPPLSSNRLRSTWLATHIAMGTRLPELLRAAGVVSAVGLSQLVQYVEPLPWKDALKQLRGSP